MHVRLPASGVNYASIQSLNRLGLAGGDNPQMKKLRQAASEFESMLISNWWSTMKESGMGNSDDETDPGKSTLDQMGIMALSSAIATGKGGLGLGQMLVNSLVERQKEALGGEGGNEK